MELIIQIDDKRHLDMVADFVRKLGLTFRIKKQDETEYLLSNETNKRHLLNSLENIEKGNVVSFEEQELITSENFFNAVKNKYAEINH